MLQFAAGELVGGTYRVTAGIASRPSSWLYAAEHERLRYRVVLKLVPSHGPQGDAARREVAALARLRHPNNVQVIDAGTHTVEHGAVPFIALEYVEGESLARIIQLHRRLAPLRAVRLGAQLLAALDEAHRQGVVHGDIKPENVLVVGGNIGADHLKLIDYGVAELVGTERRDTTGLKVFGTPAYAAPEIARGERPSIASDVYAVGALLYECLAGRRPFEGPDAVSILYRRLNEMHVPLSDLVPTEPALAAVVERALLWSPADRFESAAAMRAALLSLDAARLEAIPVGEYFPLEPRSEVHTVVIAAGSSQAPEAPPPLGPARDDQARLLSVEEPVVWVLAGDPGVDRAAVHDALLTLRGCDVRVLDEVARQEAVERLEARTVGAPWVLLFGDLHVLLEDPLFKATAASGETARMLVSSHANAELLQSTINACGLDYQICLPAPPEQIAAGVRLMIERSLHLRRHYDELRLCVNDALDDLHRLSERHAAAGGLSNLHRRMG